MSLVIHRAGFWDPIRLIEHFGRSPAVLHICKNVTADDENSWPALCQILV